MNSPKQLPHQIIQQLNAFRTNPQSLSQSLQDRKHYINHNKLLFSRKHPNKSIRTKEGTFAVNQLIGQLLNDRSLQPLKHIPFLSQCAQWIAFKYQQQNVDEHIFISKVSKEVRAKIDEHRQYQFPTVKCLIGVSFKEEKQPLLTLLVDDGDELRQKRRILISNGFQYCGAGSVQLSDPSLVCTVYLLANMPPK